jgi:LemA protein
MQPKFYEKPELGYNNSEEHTGRKMITWIAVSLVILFLFWMIFIYNRLVALKNEVRNAWKQIDVQLKRRHDLIPNLVNVVKGYMQYERDTLEKVVTARTRALAATYLSEKAAAENVLTQALGSLFAVMENYPVLKSNLNVMELQEELTSTENKISFSRQLYNDLVANYSTKLEIFPNTLVASLFGFRKEDFFSAEKGDTRVPPAAMQRDGE